MGEQQVEQQTRPITPRQVGEPLVRLDGGARVTGRATYAVEHGPDSEVPVRDPLHLWLVQSTIAKGRVTGLGRDRALDHPGVVAVIDHTDAPRLEQTDNGELAILQDARVGFRGQVVAVVVAETPEAAREGAALVSVAAALDLEDGVVRDVRIALGGVAHKPWRATRAEEALRGQRLTAAAVRAAAEAELEQAEPGADTAYKVAMVRNTTELALRRLAGESFGEDA